MRRQVINELFEQITAEDGKIDIKSPFCLIIFQYANSRLEIVDALKNYGPLVINNQQLTIEER